MRRFRAWLNSLLALHGSPKGIAAGFAIGLGLSLVPIPVAGMLAAMALVPVLRLNPVSTYLGTAVVNPLTIPFIYFAELWLGLRLFGREPPSLSELEVLDVAGWWQLFGEILGPFAVGSALLIVFGGGGSYLAVLFGLRRWRTSFSAASTTSAPVPGRESALLPAANERRSAGDCE